MNRSLSPPKNIDAFKERIIKEYDSFSKRLQQVANFITDNPYFVASSIMTEIADQANLPISTFSRFAKHMGFSGFLALQTLFKNEYLLHPRDYKERVRKALQAKNLGENSPQIIFHEFGEANIEALNKFTASVAPEKLERAIQLMEAAQTIYIEGTRRAYPVAFYMWYALMKSHKNVVLLDDMHGMLSIVSQKITEKDLLIAFTYSPYAIETTNLIQSVHKRNTPIICITDNQVSDFGAMIDVCFEAVEGEAMGFRSLVCSMYLAQVLAVSLMMQEVKCENLN